MKGKLLFNREELERLYTQEGKSTPVIAALYGCSDVTVSNYLRRYQIPTHKRSKPARDLLERLYVQEGHTTQQIGTLLGCSDSSVCNYLHAYGIPLRVGQPPKGWHPDASTRARLSAARRGSGNARYGKPASPETRAKQRAARLGKPNMLLRGRPAPHGKPTLYQRADGTTVKMRSTWEARAAAAFDALGVEWQYEPQRFLLEEGRSYTPDFWIPAHQAFYEIKGWFHERHQRTVRQFRSLYPAHPLVVLTAPGLYLLEDAARRTHA